MGGKAQTCTVPRRTSEPRYREQRRTVHDSVCLWDSIDGDAGRRSVHATRRDHVVWTGAVAPCRMAPLIRAYVESGAIGYMNARGYTRDETPLLWLLLHTLIGSVHRVRDRGGADGGSGGHDAAVVG